VTRRFNSAPLSPAVLALVLAATGCASALPRESPRLRAMEEPLALANEPDDEAARIALAPGAFTGVVVGDSRDTLDAMLEEPEGLLVTAVVENSPAAWAGIEPGDLLLELEAPSSRVLRWPSEWREVELESEPGTRLVLLVDRAGAERTVELVTEERLHPSERGAPERVREEERAGVVLRTATEVEARAAGLGPGGGAVVVGLTRESPWRAAGVRYGDLVRAVDGVDVAHPMVVLQQVRAAEADEVELELLRDGERLTVRAPLTRREGELRELSIPLVYSYRKESDRKSWSALLGIVRWESTPAAWRLRLLWLFRMSGGDADRLESVDPESANPESLNR
jgi:C-terminal processing protease CtpA/Prc